MRKVMILASMLAMVMLAASPALAQTQSSEQNASGTNINQLSQQCQNVIGDINVEGGDNTAVVGGDQYSAGGEQYADGAQYNEVAQESNTDVTIVQNCVQEAQQTNVNINVDAPAAPEAPADDQYQAPADDDAPADDQYAAPEDDAGAGADAGKGAAAPAGEDDAATDAAAGAAEGASAPAAEGSAVSVLPDTGGASLFTLGAGALLVAGGLLARRIVR